MTTVQPDSENIRRAIKWLLEERKFSADIPISKLIEEAAVKYDLSPMETEFHFAICR